MTEADAAPARTRDTVVRAAMELFGRQGFRTTTIAQIEAAAGLSPGAGGLYRHFPSKRALLEEGLRRQAEQGRSLAAFLEDPDGLAALGLHDRLQAVARAGLRRLETERDVNRLLVRDLAAFPDLLAQVRERELAAVVGMVAAWLQAQPETPVGDPDWEALASVVVSAISHYWVLRDVYDGVHPHGVDEERFVRALADLAARTWRTAD
ncbi:TetR/AcrR family transcriptional regulator [Microbacterium elymi]|uniref:TetR/AcrR family transcriptional regulator n=1 Tax=Microbacterium elymi TaxID=2909587 RepID=A0ABY5NHV2_9MICO|nr:TetR/AcrR family transcriptional regulator [Microbacterium elymi]UUT34728.1 TetR/AcrR family transcriptional regulator [Microbacterium elymi]